VTPRAALLLAAGLALAACGGGAGGDGGGSAVSTASPVPGAGAAPPGIDLAAFAGDPVDEAELGLVTLGYGRAGRSGEVTYWLNRDTGSCAALAIAGGRVAQAGPAPRGAC
jgi:hypothetical protein